ncbi:glycosyltransferase family 92 protein F13G3.3-like [Ruditapes philippinarum]|uniref:glycosyltransferase family 92 protein F13G3.3-like n=1 Tax=Ruditapes philippinarum TaxID=129788 RepID=UPI00295C36C0|nr:glycosyltransferase family 92 protein F13G3.3-like [Ruditapes philippinarum]
MFTVCLTPLNFRYNRYYEIIEWIELNRILGAEQFIVYNYSSGSNVQNVLEYYSKRGIVKVVPWNLPVKVDTLRRSSNKPEIHYFGQVAALHDCLYRNKGISEFIVNLDLDEFIIPHDNKSQSWSDIIQQVKQNFNAYLFRNTFFKKEWDNSGIDIQNKSFVDKLQLVTLQKLQHERKLFAPRSRSKYIAKTANVSHLMIHEVPGVYTKVVPPEVAFLHHYRDWGTTNDTPRNKVLDNTVPNKFGSTLVKNVLKVRNDIENMP